jgi:hypothetical protein
MNAASSSHLVFTRYLYSKKEVYQSLLVALLDRKRDESLFWLFELYYSGFEKEAADYVEKIYKTFYESQNQGFWDRLQNRKETMDPDLWLGTIIVYLCGKPFDISTFIEEHYGVRCSQNETYKQSTFLVQLKQENLEKYKTLQLEANESLHYYLKQACRFASRKEVNKLFDNKITDFRREYIHNWLYFACKSPIWFDRIRQYGGKIDDENQKIIFPDQDKECDFYDEWNLEPDEQPEEVKEKSLGESKQISVFDFCKKYGAKISIRVKKAEPKIDKLTNCFIELHV